MADITYSNTEENRYWLQIIGDYARFLIQAFSPDQSGEIQRARDFISQFDNLLARARQDLTPDQLSQLNRESYAATQNIQQFFLQMLSQQIRSGYPILIKPAFISNAVTWTQEYLYLLNAFINNKQPKTGTALQHEIYWLPIFIQIAKHIQDSLGLYQVGLRKQAEDFSNELINLLLASIELESMSRINADDYPILNEHYKTVLDIFKGFSKYIDSLTSLSQQNRIPGTLSTLYLDRTNRMICYVLRQLATLTDMKLPECDPARPRISNV